MNATKLPTEVELVYEVMPCNAMRISQEPNFEKHSCAYFRQWGTYHTFDYIPDFVPEDNNVPMEVKYIGRASLLPEVMSGCRKSPIMAVGINPNLPGWFKSKRGALNPSFDSYKQYAHYFRYRSTWKLILTEDDYENYGGGDDDTPFSNFQLNIPVDINGNKVVKAVRDDQTMYKGYLGLLTSLAEKMEWNNTNFSLSEDFAYMNMIACPSAYFRTNANPKDPTAPYMTVKQRDGIISECFSERRHFLRQLFQSLPNILLVFSQTTATSFIKAMNGNFTEGNPQPNDSVEDLLEKTIRLKYGMPDGKLLDCRVIFSPHISGTPEEFERLREKVLNQLVDEAQRGGLKFDASTGHLKRSKGLCNFCPMLEIGPCDYIESLNPISKKTKSDNLKSFSEDVQTEKEKQIDLMLAFEKNLVSDKNSKDWAENI
jgi:hypothetical protein